VEYNLVRAVVLASLSWSLSLLYHPYDRRLDCG
jgi:hypothetical protein